MKSSSEEQLASPRSLLDNGYSLEADMLFGWRPTQHSHKPIELTYNSSLPTPLKNNNKKTKQVYQGYRPPNSFIIHKTLAETNNNTYFYDFKDPEITTFACLSRILPDPNLPWGMKINNSLIFDSHFESGNLDEAFQVSKNEYDLYIRSDTNTEGHMQWFFFSVSGIQQSETVKFNILNFTRSSNLYELGMRVKAYSQNTSQTWTSAGENFSFGPSKISRPGKKAYYSLSFEYYLEESDKVWFATNIPYTLNRLQKLISSLSINKEYQNSEIEQSVLTKSMSMVDIPLLTLTNTKIKPGKKKHLLIVGRVHPGETVGSWVMEGFLRFLCARHPEAQYLRDRYIIKVVPMINVDGVIAGNSRTCMCGEDLNRRYKGSPEPLLHHGIKSIKDLAASITAESEKKLMMFLDIHGHFCKKGSFMYGPHYPLHSEHYYKSKIIPKLLSERTEIFRFFSSRFKIEKKKEGTARMVMAKEFGIVYSYTLENSYFGYLDSERNTHEFSEKDLLELGEKLARSIFEFSVLINEEKEIRRIRANKRRKGLHKRQIESEIVMEDFSVTDEPETKETQQAWKTPKEKIASLEYEFEPLRKRKIEDLIEEIKQENIDFSGSESEDSSSDPEEEQKEETEETLKTIEKQNSVTIKKNIRYQKLQENKLTPKKEELEKLRPKIARKAKNFSSPKKFEASTPLRNMHLTSKTKVKQNLSNSLRIREKSEDQESPHIQVQTKDQNILNEKSSRSRSTRPELTHTLNEISSKRGIIDIQHILARIRSTSHSKETNSNYSGLETTQYERSNIGPFSVNIHSPIRPINYAFEEEKPKKETYLPRHSRTIGNGYKFSFMPRKPKLSYSKHPYSEFLVEEMSIFKKLVALREKRVFQLRIHVLESNLPLNSEFLLIIKRGKKQTREIQEQTDSQNRTILTFEQMYIVSMFRKNMNYLKKTIKFCLEYNKVKAKAELDISEILKKNSKIEHWEIPLKTRSKFYFILTVSGGFVNEEEQIRLVSEPRENPELNEQRRRNSFRISERARREEVISVEKISSASPATENKSSSICLVEHKMIKVPSQKKYRHSPHPYELESPILLEARCPLPLHPPPLKSGRLRAVSCSKEESTSSSRLIE